MDGSCNYVAAAVVNSSSGSWQGAFGSTGGFGYQEDASGFKLLGHRYYDSSTGRFLTRDPIKDGQNWYGYMAGEVNPLTTVDPTGLFVKGGLGVSGSVQAPWFSFSVGAEVVIDRGGNLGGRFYCGQSAGCGAAGYLEYRMTAEHVWLNIPALLRNVGEWLRRHIEFWNAKRRGIQAG